MSRLPFELLLALRYLRPKRTFVSVITVISVLGVTLGVAVLIIVISVMSGFEHQLQEKVLGFNAHLKIFKVNPDTGQPTTMTDYSRVMSVVNSNRNVTISAPFVIEQVMLQTEPEHGAGQISAPYLRGIDVLLETNTSLLLTNVIGSARLDGFGVLIGKDLAGNLHLDVGDRVTVYSPRDLEEMMKARTNKDEVVVSPRDFEVRGIFDTGFWEYDSQFVLASIENAQDLYRLDDDVHGVTAMLRDPYQADIVRDQLRRVLGREYRITSWTEENSTMAAVMVEKNVMLYILFFIVIVAAFGITCTLITFVVLKTREIGLLKALGATSRQVMWIFLSQSMMVSTLGVLIGAGLGRLAIAYRNEFLHFMRRMTGLELFPANIYSFSDLPALIVVRDILIICGGSFLICLVAAAFPVWNASRLKPVEALRHE